MSLSKMVTGSVAGPTTKTTSATAGEKVKNNVVKTPGASPGPLQVGSALGQAAAKTVIAALQGLQGTPAKEEEKKKKGSIEGRTAMTYRFSPFRTEGKSLSLSTIK